MVTPERRRHLDTAVTRYPVELVLVTRVSAFQCFLAPETGFDRGRGVR
ncbi:hypothetical protein ASZ90_015649 [hydrocarbon metagenome]|uniref:Uncharacterized protein n=1 Tax=hydrocarbon metagenome TaxID=938273 RepID=A0A0W8F2U1_9ZZZZ